MLDFTVEPNLPDRELRWMARKAPEGLITQAFGEVDAHNEADWQRMLVESSDATPASALLVIDCRALDFMNCGALVALAKQTVDSRQRGVTVRLVVRQSGIRRVITACGLDDVISAHADLESALTIQR
ncbi:STAS domain-containing protein [Mycobacterium sp. TNTM28]|uniref:STAS domain-containing protein n=1 Tax=[Mycobacterium] fortunisiensis TaxID=2600579 RepID=A0ABS6KRS4_9MYCO|nr:STAS domain-containing protein [[Mycobacterium] fortunisiensis]MBU9766261.1 STAS domain-containing protein [[Mycobacterium] fortunisiensis]